MNNSELKSFKEWDHLLQQADRTITGLLDTTVHASGLLDGVSLETDRDLALRIRDREGKLIRKIKNALKRLGKGTFGICEICGEEIALKRLKVRSVTTYCIDCKKACRKLYKELSAVKKSDMNPSAI